MTLVGGACSAASWATISDFEQAPVETDAVVVLGTTTSLIVSPDESLDPERVAPPTAPTTTACDQIVHIGDSTSVGMIDPEFRVPPEQRIDAQYARVGVTTVHLEIEGARSIVEGLPGQVNAHDVAAAYREQGYDGCWVLALGTTDTANVAVGSNVGRRERIDRMMSLIGDNPVIWVNARTLVPSGAWSDEMMQAWNMTLVEATADYPNMAIYDWAAVADPSWFNPDQIHYTLAGNIERSRRLADALVRQLPGTAASGAAPYGAGDFPGN